MFAACVGINDFRFLRMNTFFRFQMLVMEYILLMSNACIGINIFRCWMLIMERSFLMA